MNYIIVIYILNVLRELKRVDFIGQQRSVTYQNSNPYFNSAELVKD